MEANNINQLNQNQAQTPVSPKKKSNIFIIISAVLIFFLILCFSCCAGVILIGGGTALEKNKNAFKATICSNNSPDFIYDENVSSIITVSYTRQQFNELISEISQNCQEIENATLIDVFQKGWNVSSNDDNPKFSGKLGSKQYTVIFNNIAGNYEIYNITFE